MKSPTIWKNLPKVGIRPTIDGRLGGVRESLEEQTMNQAKVVLRLIEESMKYPNGEHPVRHFRFLHRWGCKPPLLAEQFSVKMLGFLNRNSLLVTTVQRPWIWIR